MKSFAKDFKFQLNIRFRIRRDASARSVATSQHSADVTRTFCFACRGRAIILSHSSLPSTRAALFSTAARGVARARLSDNFRPAIAQQLVHKVCCYYPVHQSRVRLRMLVKMATLRTFKTFQNRHASSRLRIGRCSHVHDSLCRPRCS